jgi:hypothetical protein
MARAKASFYLDVATICLGSEGRLVLFETGDSLGCAGGAHAHTGLRCLHPVGRRSTNLKASNQSPARAAASRSSGTSVRIGKLRLSTSREHLLTTQPNGSD